ncbi:MAG: tetratricopeptide repeat protein [Pseudomonadota bacterium]|nr:tetratricopeptide repeat protein [Pseudomonadota bacterium]
MSHADIAAELQRRAEAEAREGRRERATIGATLRIVGIAFAAVFAEGSIMWMLYAKMGAPWLGGLGHLLVVGLLALATRQIRPNGSRSRFLALLTLSTAFLGIFGALGTLYAMLLHVQFRRRATPFEEWYASLFPDSSDAPSEKLYEMLKRGLADSASQDNVTSFTDVLRYGSIEQKRSVISLLSRDFRPEFAPALQSALADPNPAVRVQAATAAASIENDFLERSIELEKAAAKAPTDAAAQMKLARHFDDYAFSGILDGDRQAENRRRAADAYRQAFAIDPKLADAGLGYGRLLVRTGRLAEAADWFEGMFAKGFVRPAEVGWYMEALYRLGDFGRLRYAVAGFGDDLVEAPGMSERMRDVIRAWQGNGLAGSSPALGEHASGPR